MTDWTGIYSTKTKKKKMCVFQVSALKKLGMVGRRNMLFYKNI